MILVGDIGGTNTRLALARFEGGAVQLRQMRTYATPNELPPLLRTYLADSAAEPLTAVALCGAGPLRADGSIALTNHPCVLDPAAIAAAANAPARVVNDFAAVGHAVPLLGSGDLRRCGGDAAAGQDKTPRIVIGPGTGLGLATLVPDRGTWRVVPGEGGHIDLAPVDEEELTAWQYLRRNHRRVSAELALGGSGLERLAAAAGAVGLAAPDVTHAAAAGDTAALSAIRLWTRWLGRVAGNAALTAGASGGVYIAGGIVPALGTLFSPEVFRSGFEDKEPFSDWLKRIPAWIIIHAQPGLLGLAALAAGSSTELASSGKEGGATARGEKS